ncbi:adenine deaminase [Exophiala xenobiotica]|nr:adenine deaminase [Exophiala xenobiotica]KAK5391808.1 adenine deaminase [Exophiala xenobiotica]KAK5406467.1 adenine deaminase [Exophiala xenobiotica]KAK5453066.1 adenine deaminase [Exophiala xenobiotica]KAK5471754.1 adenine deaminase [Exophiala xenobiotica]
MIKDDADFVAGLPKAELHIHLEGALEPGLVRKLAARNGIVVPSAVTERSVGYDFHDLPSFLAVYYGCMGVLQTEDDFFDLCYSYLHKVHSQNVVHVEMFFDPQAHTRRGIAFSTVLGGYRRAIVTAQRELNISASLIMCFLRDLDPGWAMDTLTQALPYKPFIVGVGLDSDERDNPPSKFAAVFRRAREEGFFLTMHCDIDQKDSIEHIRQALQDIKVDRLDHGTNIVEDGRLVDLVQEKRIGLTCCPISNSVVTEDWKRVEIATLLKANVLCTIASDDPALFRGYMNENLNKMLQDGSFSRADLVQLQRNAFHASWLSSHKRDHFLDLLEDYSKPLVRKQ